MHFDGIVLVDKPQGITSHDVVDALRKATGFRRIGHTGTLDPRATGLLIMCLGQATRLSQHLTGLDKIYEGTMRLGLVTSSHDLDGETLQETPVPGSLSQDAIQAACARYVGAIQQIPPMVSAIKIGGKRLYKIAREGQEIERPPRAVKVHSFSITHWTPPDAGVRIECSSGAYVRTLCHDVGHDLGCGATLAQLRRTHVGAYSIDNAAPLDELTTADAVARHLTPMDQALTLPTVSVDKIREALVASGNAFSAQALLEPCPVTEGWVQVKNARGKLIALAVAQPTAAGARIQPKCVFLKK